MLKVNNVCKSFVGEKVLDDVSFCVQDSSILGLAGPSGSGKSTLLRCIQELETVDSGSIGCNVKTGFMFQDFQLFPHMTVLENLIYAPKLQDKKKDHKKHAEELLASLGIFSKAQSYPGVLSGGQKQRTALARTLMIYPSLLLCDEPTSGLDIATTLDVVSLLKVVQGMGITMVIASHDLDFLTKIADNIILLKEGKIVADVQPKLQDDPVGCLRGQII